MKRLSLLLLVFWSGAVALGVELTASRLLAPFFGTSTLVWAALIGMILVYLSVGYWLGGRWADRSPRVETLVSIVSVAAVLVALVPVIASPVLRLSVQGFAALDAGLLVGSLVGVLLLFTAPMILLGRVSPFAIRLVVQNPEHLGRDAGQLSALSTLGSFVGTFLPVLWLVPEYGTRATFFILAMSLLLVVALVAAGQTRRAVAWPVVGVVAVLAMVLWMRGQGIKPGSNPLYEGESLYHYIRVVQQDGWTMLELNEGQGVHSVYQQGAGMTGGIWDFYLLAPFFNPAPHDPTAQPKEWAIIGSAAGSTPRSIQTVYPQDTITGIEIDDEVVQVGRDFFGMDELTNLDVVVDDGRTWLQQDDGRYDVIGVDAYRQPYIPFHLATIEFFTEARAHLKERGVVAINVGRAPGDWRLVDALATTMRQVFPNAYAIDMDSSYNTLLIATNTPVTPDDVSTNLGAVADPILQGLVQRADGHVRVHEADGLVFTDDRAPVEQVVDLMIANYALGN